MTVHKSLPRRDWEGANSAPVINTFLSKRHLESTQEKKKVKPRVFPCSLSFAINEYPPTYLSYQRRSTHSAPTPLRSQVANHSDNKDMHQCCVGCPKERLPIVPKPKDEIKDTKRTSQLYRRGKGGEEMRGREGGNRIGRRE